MAAEYGFEPHSADTIYLSDVSSKDKTWDRLRAASDKVKNLYRGTIFDCYADRIAACSGILSFKVFHDPGTGVIRFILSGSNFCRCRHCPVCQSRRSMTWRARFFVALPKILRDYPKARFLFLTLTVRNCPVEELRSTLSHMNKSWVLLTKRGQFPALGWLKSVEVTRGTNGDAHPHLHAILMVNPSYFGSGYLSKQKWIALWRSALHVNYDPSVAIRVVKSTSESPDSFDHELKKGFCEVLKYSLKVDDLTFNQDWLLRITEQLHKTRAVSVGGVFRSYISEKEPDDLITEELQLEEKDDYSLCFGWREKVQRYQLLLMKE